jgi:hypothetical protein
MDDEELIKRFNEDIREQHAPPPSPEPSGFWTGDGTSDIVLTSNGGGNWVNDNHQWDDIRTVINDVQQQSVEEELRNNEDLMNFITQEVRLRLDRGDIEAVEEPDPDEYYRHEEGLAELQEDHDPFDFDEEDPFP